MATKQKSLMPVITLRKPAKEKLGKLLSEPQTQLQKDSVKKSAGVYTYYIEKWKKLHK